MTSKRSRLPNLLLAAIALTAACGTKIPARVETIAGHDVEIATAGTSGPTVVFEAGLGDDWTSWDDVASEVARGARVFAYSRPGYGASSPATTPRDPRTIVEELRALLVHEGYAPPYVLVGHSFGGAYMELYAKAHPEEVLGVVLVDPRHRDFLAACEAARLDSCGIPDAVLATQGASTIAEYRAFPLGADQIRAAGSFGTYPVRVLTATDHPVSAPREALWRSMLGELAGEATHGEQVVVDGSGHYIQRDRPAAVVDAITQMLPSP